MLDLGCGETRTSPVGNDNAFRLSGGARGIDNIDRVLLLQRCTAMGVGRVKFRLLTELDLGVYLIE